MAYLTRYRTGSFRVDLSAADAAEVTLDGATLEELGCWPTSIELAPATATVSTASVPGRHGSVDLTLEDGTGGAYLTNRTLTIGIATDASWGETLADVKPAIGAFMGRVVEVWASPLGGTMEGRCAVGQWDDSRGASACTLTFDVGPMVSGDAVEVELAEGANAVEVSGNRPALAVYTLTATDGATSISVYDGEGHTLEYSPGASITATVTIDCDAQAVYAGSSLVAPTVESDYPVLLPGAATVTLTNCTGALTYVPQTLI